MIIQEIVDKISDTSAENTYKRIKGINVSKETGAPNVVIENYMAQKTLIDEAMDQLLCRFGADTFYTHATQENIQIISGTTSEGHAFVTYANTDAMDVPERIFTGDSLGRDNCKPDVVFAFIALLYSYSLKIHYKALQKAIENLKPEDLLLLTFSYGS